MAMTRIIEIKERLAAATPWPWTVFNDHPLHSAPVVCADGSFKGGIFVCACNTSADNSGIKDANLIANAPSDIAYLLERIEELEKYIEKLEMVVVAVENLCCYQDGCGMEGLKKIHDTIAAARKEKRG